ncbi:Rho Guanine Nucleotide Exchange Factor 10-Like Protein [Manis pentadactyla]|nr:Rho Guanine Nucleotide Exchange Factor 10-Like Protein [Manis pentadactyla]
MVGFRYFITYKPGADSWAEATSFKLSVASPSRQVEFEVGDGSPGPFRWISPFQEWNPDKQARRGLALRSWVVKKYWPKEQSRSRISTEFLKWPYASVPFIPSLLEVIHYDEETQTVATPTDQLSPTVCLCQLKVISLVTDYLWLGICPPTLSCHCFTQE